MTGAVVVETVDGRRLEGRWDSSEQPVMAAVFCHPHPRHRGTMRAPLMEKVTTELVAAGLAVLRFNFRGVGGSTGEWSGGEGEIDDVAAAVATAVRAFPDLPLGLAGWSFGAATALNWIARDRRPVPYVGIAPALNSNLSPGLPAPEELPPAPRRFVLGDRDQFTTVEELAAYATSVGADLVVLPGSDHFFYFREQRVARAVVDGLLGPDGG